MKNISLILLTLITSVSLTSCKKDQPPFFKSTIDNNEVVFSSFSAQTTEDDKYIIHCIEGNHTLYFKLETPPSRKQTMYIFDENNYVEYNQQNTPYISSYPVIKNDGGYINFTKMGITLGKLKSVEAEFSFKAKDDVTDEIIEITGSFYLD